MYTLYIHIRVCVCVCANIYVCVCVCDMMQWVECTGYVSII